MDLAIFFEKRENRIYKFFKVKNRTIILTKSAVSVSVTFIWLILLSLINFIVVGGLNGYGSFNYPAYLINNWKDNLSSVMPDNMSIPNGKVIIISLIYILLVLIFLASIGAFLSVIFKKSIVVIGIIAVLIVGWSLIEKMDFIQPIRRLVPMSYLNPIELLCQPDYLAENLSLLVGTLYLGVVSIICLIAASIVFKKYKLRSVHYDIRN